MASIRFLGDTGAVTAWRLLTGPGDLAEMPRIPEEAPFP
jgi:hypothetical protein